MRASVIYPLCCAALGGSVVHAKEVRIRSARIEGMVDFEDAGLQASLHLLRCFIGESMCVERACLPAIFLIRSYTHRISADGLCANEVVLNTGFWAKGRSEFSVPRSAITSTSQTGRLRILKVRRSSPMASIARGSCFSDTASLQGSRCAFPTWDGLHDSNRAELSHYDRFRSWDEGQRELVWNRREKATDAIGCLDARARFYEPENRAEFDQVLCGVTRTIGRGNKWDQIPALSR